MALVFIAVLVVLVLTHFVPDIARMRQFDWLRAWAGQGANQNQAGFGLFLAIGVPTLACFLLQLLLRGSLFGLLSLLFAIAVLAYCLGPRDLEHDVEAVDKAPDSNARLAAAQALAPDEASAPLPWQAEALVEAAFIAALRRVFGVVFWFVVLGPAGAVLYRLTQLLAYSPAQASALPAAQHEAVVRFARALDWLPAHGIALALAVASDFDAVLKSWRDYHAAHPKGYASFDPDFLNAIARASVDADVAAGDGHVVDVHDPLVALDDAMTLVRRVLIVWVALMALVVIGGWFS